MKIHLLSIVLTGALCVACSTTNEAPSPSHQMTLDAIETRSDLPLPDSAPTVQPDQITDTRDDEVDKRARSGSVMAHPPASMAVESLNEVSAEPLRATGD